MEKPHISRDAKADTDTQEFTAVPETESVSESALDASGSKETSATKDAETSTDTKAAVGGAQDNLHTGNFQVAVDEDDLAHKADPASAETSRDIFPAKGVEQIVSRALLEVPGIVPVDSKLAGLGGRGFPRVVAQLDPVHKVAVVEAAIAVRWPSPVTEVAKAARQTIEEAVTAFTGYKTTRANVVVGHAEAGSRVTSAAIANRRAVKAISPVVTEPEVRKPVTTNHTDISSVELLDEPAVTSIEAPQEVDVRSIEVLPEPTLNKVNTPAEPEVRSIKVPEPPQLREIHTRTMYQVTGVDTPAEPELTPVEILDAPSLKPVEITRQASARRVDYPQDKRLRQITTATTRVLTPEAPKPRNLADVQIRKVATQEVKMPRMKPLKKVTVASQPLRSVGIKASAPVKHVQVPEPVPLRAIDVVPANADTLKMKG